VLGKLADHLAERAALWAYFSRPDDELALRNAMCGYYMAATADQ
jgi:hypothetical protein